MSSRRKRGFTLIEVAIGLTIMTIVVAGALTVTRSSQQAFRGSVSDTVLNSRASRALNRIARAVGPAGASTLFPAPTAPLSTEVISFQRVAGWEAAQPAWTGDIEIRLQLSPGELDNGLDDDGDGLIDECRIVLTEELGGAQEKRVTLLDGVREYLNGEIPNGLDDNGNGLIDERGLCFALIGDLLEVSLTMEGLDSRGRTRQVTYTTTIAMRN